MLEGGDWAMDIGESGLEVGEDFRGRPARWFCRRPGRQLRRRAAAAMERGADRALGPVEPPPDALPGAFAEPGIDGLAGGENGAGDGELEELPQRAGVHAEASDFIGPPDAEGAAAAGPSVAVAAKDPPGADGIWLAIQAAVADERADDLAVRARRLLEPLCDGQPFLGAAEEPALLTQGHAFPKNLILAASGGAG
jgi:hypothetical protein